MSGLATTYFCTKWAEWSSIADKVFRIIIGNNSTFGGLPDAFSAQARQHFELLDEYWFNVLAPRIEPFASEKILGRAGESV